MDTHKASAGVTKGWSFIRGFVEVVCVTEVVAQFGTYRHSPNEVRGDFFTADLSLPEQEMFQCRMQKLVSQEFWKQCVFSTVQPLCEGSLQVSTSSPVSFASAEGEGKVGCYFLKVLQRNVTFLVVVVIFHYGLQGATEQFKIHLSELHSLCFSLSSNKEVKESGVCCRVRYSHPPSV